MQFSRSNHPKKTDPSFAETGVDRTEKQAVVSPPPFSQPASQPAPAPVAPQGYEAPAQGEMVQAAREPVYHPTPAAAAQAHAQAARSAVASQQAVAADPTRAPEEQAAWQSAFRLAPNVRFTRTPESALSRHGNVHMPAAAEAPDVYAQFAIEGAGDRAPRAGAQAPVMQTSGTASAESAATSTAATVQAAKAEAFRNSIPKTGSPLIVRPRVAQNKIETQMPPIPVMPPIPAMPMTPVSGPVSQVPGLPRVDTSMPDLQMSEMMVPRPAHVSVASSGSVDSIAGLQQLAAAMRRGLVQEIPAGPAMGTPTSAATSFLQKLAMENAAAASAAAASAAATDGAPTGEIASQISGQISGQVAGQPIAISDHAFWEMMPFDLAELPAPAVETVATPAKPAAPLPVIVQTVRPALPVLPPIASAPLVSQRHYAPAGSVVTLYREVTIPKQAEPTHAMSPVAVPLPSLVEAAIQGQVHSVVQAPQQMQTPVAANQADIATTALAVGGAAPVRAPIFGAAAVMRTAPQSVPAAPVRTTAPVLPAPVVATPVAAPSVVVPAAPAPVAIVPAPVAAPVTAETATPVADQAPAASTNVTITVPAATPARGHTVRPSEAEYEFPPIGLLQQPKGERGQAMQPDALQQSAGLLESILEDFGVKGEIIDVRPGPVVTLYEFEPAPGVKSSRVIGLADDIARSMSALSARVAVVPGRNVIGIELPNAVRETVFFRELIECEDYWETKHRLALCLGKTIGGEPVIAELAKMPHLLVAGTTGSGKSVAINTMILSLLYRLRPEECRLIMIDPKMLELSVYDGIPHLLTPVVTDPKKAVLALKWAVREMEDRYRKMSRLAVRNIDGYNQRAASAREAGEVITVNVQVGFDRHNGEIVYEEQEMDLAPMPYIVVIIDEMADLMMVAGKEIEGAVQRLAQMARAAGIHVIMATQRPSVDVITGTIKANFPTRISFQVTSKIDSRTILGEQGAENLLGQGDMLHMAGGGRISRVHGPFVSDAEVEHVVKHLKLQGRPEYLGTVTEDEEEAAGEEVADEAVFDKGSMGGDESDDLYEKAVKVVLKDRKCSTSYIQRRLSVGYNRAASLVERMEQEGLVGPANHVGKREIIGDGRGPQGSGMED